MPKYYDFKVCGYYLYFTSHCIIECMHVHASDRRLTEAGSAKLFVRSNGDTVLQNRGILTDRELNRECILPDPFDRRVAEQVAKAVSETAVKTGLARCK